MWRADHLVSLTRILLTIFAAQHKNQDADIPVAKSSISCDHPFLTVIIGLSSADPHFARRTDDWRAAQREGMLHRNFRRFPSSGRDTGHTGNGAFPPSAARNFVALPTQNKKEFRKHYHHGGWAKAGCAVAAWPGLAL